MPFSFEQTTDYELVRSIITHPKIWEAASDDFTSPLEEFQPNPGFLYLLVEDGEEMLGLWAFHAHSQICWEIHTCLLPAAWGERGRRAALEMLEWLWANTPCLRLITSVPAFNRLALRFAEAAGMIKYGINSSSYMKNGKLCDQILLGLSRPTSALNAPEVLSQSTP